MTKTLKIKDIIGSEYAVSTENGEKILSQIKKILKNNEKVIISFEGINIVISAFLNRILGDLYADYPSSYIDQFVNFIETNENIVED